MQEMLFWTASAAAVVTLAIHIFGGGIRVVRPLLADTTLPHASKWLSYYCWHIATLTILAIGAMFAYCAFAPGQRVIAAFVTAFTAILSGLSAAVAIKGGIHPLRFPSTTLFAAIAVFGAVALAVG